MTLAVYAKLEVSVDRRLGKKGRADGEQRILLVEINVQRDMLDLLKRATSEAGRTGTDKLHMKTILKRVLELSVDINFSETSAQAMRQIQRLEHLFQDMGDRREEVWDAVHMWRDRASLQWKNAWSDFRGKLLSEEDAGEKKHGKTAGRICSHVEKWASEIGKNTNTLLKDVRPKLGKGLKDLGKRGEKTLKETNVLLGETKRLWRAGLEKTGQELAHNLKDVREKWSSGLEKSREEYEMSGGKSNLDSTGRESVSNIKRDWIISHVRKNRQGASRKTGGRTLQENGGAWKSNFGRTGRRLVRNFVDLKATPKPRINYWKGLGKNDKKTFRQNIDARTKGFWKRGVRRTSGGGPAHLSTQEAAGRAAAPTSVATESFEGRPGNSGGEQTPVCPKTLPMFFEEPTKKKGEQT